MKWPILFSGVAIVVACGIYFRFFLPTEKQVEQRPANQFESVSKRLPIPSAAASTAVTTNAVPIAAPSAPMTAHLRRIYDSPDIMATINEVRHHGTADERDWAISLLYSCALLFQHPLPPIVEEGHVETPKPVDKVLEAKKKRAFASLSERCKGVKGMTSDDRTALRLALHDPAVGYTSALRELDTLTTEVRDGRWNEAQAQLITNSLYSGDPLMARDAFRAMLGAIDNNAPGGNDREHAFMLAVGGTYDSKAITEFDKLQACYTAGHCGDYDYSAGGDSDASPAVLQLVSKYRAAVDSHMDARSILAIR